MTAGVIAIDNLDDRREIVVLLEKLRPPDRWRWLRWVAKQAKTPAGAKSCEVTFSDLDRAYLRDAMAGIESADQWVTNNAYWNAFLLAEQYRLDTKKLLLCLQEIVKGKISPGEL